MTSTAVGAGPDQGQRAGPKCGANKRQGTGTCTQPAGWGTDHVGTGACKLHGGRTFAHRAKGAQVLAVKAAKQMFGQDFVIKPIDNPLAEFAAFAGRVMAWMDTMQALTEKLSDPGYQGMTGEQVRAEVQLFERSMDRANTVLATYAKLGIDERLMRVTEAQAQMIIKAIEAALTAAGLAGDPLVKAKHAVAKHLRVLPSLPESS